MCLSINYAKVMIAVLSAAFIIILSQSMPVSANPEIGPEFPICNATISAQYTQDEVAITSGGQNYLVVWEDKRISGNAEIFGIIIDTSGNPIGESFLISSATITSGLNVTGAMNDQTSPAVAFNGTNYLVVWADLRIVGEPSHIFGARVSTSGEVLDKNGIQISLTGMYGQYYPDVSSNGTDWEVVWEEDGASSMEIKGARVTSAGAVAVRSNLANTSNNERLPAIAWNGTNYILIWEDYRNFESTNIDIYGVQVTSAGAKSGSDKCISTDTGSTTSGAPGAQISADIVRGPSGTCFVVWQDGRNANKDIYGARVTSAFSVQDLGGLAINQGSGDQEDPGIGWNGSVYVCAWRDKGANRNIRATRVDTSGQPLDASGLSLFLGAAGLPSPEVACGTGSCLVAWHNLNLADLSEIDIFGATVSTNGDVGGYKELALSVPDQKEFSSAFDGVNFAVVWSERRAGMDVVRATRVALDGTVIDPLGVQLVAWPTRGQTEPSIAWNGSEYLVVWTDGVGTTSDIKGVRLTSDLEVLDAFPIDICTAEMGQYSPAVAGNGNCFMVVWTDARNGLAPDYFTDILGARVFSDGSVTALSSVICLAGNNQYVPAITTDGANFLTVWEDYRSGSPTLYCNRITSSGSVLDGVNGVLVSAAGGIKMSPQLAFDGANYLVVWSDRRNSNYDIYGVRLSTSAARVDAADIAISQVSITDETCPYVAWTGSNYYIAWQDRRSWQTSDSDIYLMRMASSGSLLDGTPTPVSQTAYAEETPIVMSGYSNCAITLYSKGLSLLHQMKAGLCGDMPPVIVASIGDAKSKADGTIIIINNIVVTAGTDQFDGFFYIEDESRASGIKVAATETVHVGDVVSVMGEIATVDGERQIDATSISIAPESGDVPEPLVMTCGALGGTALNDYTPGVIRGRGLNNLGLLVKVCGQVVSNGAGYFIIEDGSSNYRYGNAQVKIICPDGVTSPDSGFFSILGISSCELSGDDSIRRILVRDPIEMVQLQ